MKILKDFFEKHKEKIITLLLCGALLAIALSVLAFISGAIMKVFGFEYRSIGSIVLFFCCCIHCFLSVGADCRCTSQGFGIAGQSISACSKNALFAPGHIRNFLGAETYRSLDANCFSGG